MKMPLFSNAASRSQNKNLVEFKAGKMNLKGKMVHPDSRKGLVYIHQSEDSLMHFCWKDRQTHAVEDDLIIFPDDCEFKKVTQCTTGRAYILRFKSSNRKFFFWLQESKTEKDDELCRRVNEVLNNPPTPGSQRSGGVTPDGDLQNLLNNMSQQQLMQLFGGMGTNIGGLSSLLGTMNRSSQSSRASSSTGATTTISNTSASSTSVTVSAQPPATTNTTSTNSQQKSSSGEKSASGSQKPTIQLKDLQTFLSGLTVPPSERVPQQQNVDLASSLNAENLQGIINDPNHVNALQQHLPSLSVEESEKAPSEQLKSTLTSPQFQQAVSMFSTALQSGQLGPVVQQFGVGAEAVNAAQQGNMEEFVKALEKASNSKDNESSSSEKPKKPDEKKDDDNMALD